MAVEQQHGRLRLNYPYARQIGDKLCIAYSCKSTPKMPISALD